MDAWSVILEESNIIVNGHFNPRIFHPEWFIRKGLVEEWDYTSSELISLDDMSKFTLPGDKEIQVLFNQFQISTQLASERFAMRDVAAGVFSLLPETPVKQLGMNYSILFKFNNDSDYFAFGSKFAPKDIWFDSCEYIRNLPKGKSDLEVGLIGIGYHFPRYDEHAGYVMPRITVSNMHQKIIRFIVNDHIELEKSSPSLSEMLQNKWEHSSNFAQAFIKDFMKRNVEG